MFLMLRTSIGFTRYNWCGKVIVVFWADFIDYYNNYYVGAVLMGLLGYPYVVFVDIG